ncbi:hypothetical protein WMY93_009741 [Mugilogobius chulae]|uniref:Spondin domain-containing protein n=1 Tax=Mugilogobius chulae TaxID=88201 RepID=A0AAW0PIU7_9GOBI
MPWSDLSCRPSHPYPPASQPSPQTNPSTQICAEVHQKVVIDPAAFGPRLLAAPWHYLTTPSHHNASPLSPSAHLPHQHAIAIFPCAMCVCASSLIKHSTYGYKATVNISLSGVKILPSADDSAALEAPHTAAGGEREGGKREGRQCNSGVKRKEVQKGLIRLYHVWELTGQMTYSSHTEPASNLQRAHGFNGKKGLTISHVCVSDGVNLLPMHNTVVNAAFFTSDSTGLLWCVILKEERAPDTLISEWCCSSSNLPGRPCVSQQSVRREGERERSQCWTPYKDRGVEGRRAGESGPVTRGGGENPGKTDKEWRGEKGRGADQGGSDSKLSKAATVSSQKTQMMSSYRHLSSGWLWRLLVMLLKLSLSLAGPLRSLNGTECTAKGPASYILVFTGHWSPQSFPKQYPLFRPPAQWSKLIAVGHNRHFQLWDEGTPASVGVQNFAELGVTVEIMKGAKEARKRRAVGTMYRTAGIPNGIGHSSTELLMLPRTPLLSLMVKVIPSPDWFVGVNSLNLCDGSQWKEEVTFDLQPYDAGTDSGFTFSSPNFPTSPPENITKITSQMPNHPANSFYYPRLKDLPPIASIKLTRQRRLPNRQTVISNHILPNSIIPQRFSATPLDCEVSMWSSWGLCLGPCSKGGIRHRTRYILLPPANAGDPCPELEEQAECVPHSCLKRP